MNQQIIMNFTVAPSDDDIAVIANQQLENFPSELEDNIEDLRIQIEDSADDTILSDLDLEDSFDLLALYKPGAELAPGVEKKGASDDNILIIYRRPILDAWCDSGDDLTQVIRDAMIEEIASYFEFSEDDIQDMMANH